MAADCGPADEDEAPAPIPCLDGTCRTGGVGSTGTGSGGGGVDIIDDGLSDPGDGLARPPFRGVYLNDFDTVLASAAGTNRLLEWLEANDFNSISCYDLGTIFDSSVASDRLGTFIARARREAGVIHVGAVHSTATNFSGPTLTWNTRHSTAERFDAFHLEHEWWNGAGSFADTVSRLQTMTSVAHAQQPPLAAEEYIGWFQNPGDDDGNGVADFTAQEMANAVVRHSDRIMIHDYRLSPDFSYMESRLRLLSNAAATAGHDVDVVVIFSAEAAAADGPDNDFMGRYFQTHTFDEAWTVLQGQIDDASPGATAHLNFIGYQVFASRHAMAARPL